MKFPLFAALAVLCTILNATTAQAASAEGAGAKFCANFTEDYGRNKQFLGQLYFSWAEGYMSGMNIARLDDDSTAFRSMSFDQQQSYLVDFCSQNPRTKYAVAVAHLYRELHKNEGDKK